MRRILMVAGIVVVLVAGALGFSLLRAQEDDSAPTTCDGRQPTIVASRQGQVIHGTAGQDIVILREDVEYISGGGNDILCDQQGNVTAVLVPDETTSE